MASVVSSIMGWRGGTGRRSSSYANRGNVVTFENRVRGHQRQPLDLGLGYQDAIKRVAVVLRQSCSGQRVDMRDWQSGDAAPPHALRNVHRRRPGKRKSAGCVLDPDLPRTRRREVQVGRAVGQRLQQTRRKSFGLDLQPEPAVGIEKKPHSRPSKARSNSSSSGASKSSGTTNRPRSWPNVRRLWRIATRRATGCPDRVMTTSSPSAISRNSRERCVFASWTVTWCMMPG